MQAMLSSTQGDSNMRLVEACSLQIAGKGVLTDAELHPLALSFGLHHLWTHVVNSLLARHK